MRVLIAFAGLLALTSAASSQAPSTSPEANVFGEPLKTEPYKLLKTVGDPTSPFTVDHWAEQMAYHAQYRAFYNVRTVGPSSPAPAVMPSAVDAQGKPLWYDGPEQSAELIRMVRDLYDNAQFDELERLFQDWNRPSERLANGEWKLRIFWDAIAGNFGRWTNWDKTLQMLEGWKRERPTSAAAVITTALYWSQYAWDARGAGYASGVTDSGWKLFRERLAVAEKTLKDGANVASFSPLWTRIDLDVAHDLGRPFDERQRLLFSRRDSTAPYYPSYIAAAVSLTPRWGGDWDAVDAFVQRSVADTVKTDRQGLYARIYWSMTDNGYPNLNLFTGTRATWPAMKRSFEDLASDYPHSASILNNFAAAACMADDMTTFQAIRMRLKTAVTPRSWPDNFSLDLCDRTLGVPRTRRSVSR